jgi:hypothetical protein
VQQYENAFSLFSTSSRQGNSPANVCPAQGFSGKHPDDSEAIGQAAFICEKHIL